MSWLSIVGSCDLKLNSASIKDESTDLPSQPPTAQTFPSSRIAKDPYPGCFVRKTTP
jgi:hypothetical protein